jgi:hypothetical protein
MKSPALPQRREQSASGAEFYITRVNWLVSQGRDDLIDAIADEYELRLEQRRAFTGQTTAERHCERPRHARAARVVG